jgi:hypothetical protein
MQDDDEYTESQEDEDDDNVRLSPCPPMDPEDVDSTQVSCQSEHFMSCPF